MFCTPQELNSYGQKGKLKIYFNSWKKSCRTVRLNNNVRQQQQQQPNQNMSNTKKPEITPEDRKKNLKRHGWSLLIGGFLTFVISAAITGSMGSWHAGEDTSKLNFIMILPLVTVI